MRTTITLDDELIAAAMAYSGITEKSEVIRRALKDYVAREAQRRLALMGGTEPDLKRAPRRRLP
jgi:Arc/MetJ family transcription regulator